MADSPNLQDASLYAMQNLQEQTQMTHDKVACDPEFVDVVFQSRDLGGARGEYECLDRSSATPNLCLRSAVRYDGAQINQEGPQDYLQGNRDKTAGHEVGHSVGMKHHDPEYNDCMVSGKVQAGHRQYNDHHRWHVNNR
jgi:hypothetical protein